jgi:hypothetical protein
MKPVVWGVLSVSRHFTLRVQPPLAASQAVQLRAIASRSKEKAETAAHAMGIAKAYGSYEELLADREIEAVYIALPNNLHAEWVMKAADAGKHVLCEKPFAMNAAEAERAIRHAEKKGFLVMEAFMYRFHQQGPAEHQEQARDGRGSDPGHRMLRDLLLAIPLGLGAAQGGCLHPKGPRFRHRHPELGHPGLRRCPRAVHGSHPGVFPPARRGPRQRRHPRPPAPF